MLSGLKIMKTLSIFIYLTFQSLVTGYTRYFEGGFLGEFFWSTTNDTNPWYETSYSINNVSMDGLGWGKGYFVDFSAKLVKFLQRSIVTQNFKYSQFVTVSSKYPLSA